MKSRLSYLYSVLIHLLILLVLYFINIEPEILEDEFVTIGFASLGKTGAKGIKSEKIIPKKAKKTENKINEKKKLEVPKTKNIDEKNNYKIVEKKKNKPEKKLEEEDNFFDEEPTFSSGDFKLDWGGKKVRKLYDYILPEYPQGVSKEIDVKLRFTIKPDGTVGSVIPLIKADTRLELAAINALKKWRFEPLSNGKNNQIVVITFPFRLR